MSRLVETKRTTPSPREFAAALLRVVPDITKAAAGVLFAHFAGETGDGRFCWNWNLGNVKRVRGDGHDFVSLAGVWEGFTVPDEDGDGDIDEADRPLFVARMTRTGMWIADPSPDHAKAVGPAKVSLIASKGHPATWFRAYPDLQTGMEAFVAMKSNPRSRYASAWRFVLAGDHRGYAFELGRLGYYTAAKEPYAGALAVKHKAWMRSDAFELATADLQVPPVEPEPEVQVQLPSFDVVHALPDPPEHEPDFRLE